MQREVRVRNVDDAVKFAFLEHLLRITTLEAEVEAALASQPVETREFMRSLVVEKQSSPQQAIRSLESRIRATHLTASITPLARVITMSVSHGSISETAKDPSVSGYLPTLHILQLQGQYFVLYTPEMSYLDGYDPFREEDHFPIIPESFLYTIREMLYKQFNGPPPPNRKKSKAKVIAVEEVKKVDRTPPKQAKAFQETEKQQEIIDHLEHQEINDHLEPQQVEVEEVRLVKSRKSLKSKSISMKKGSDSERKSIAVRKGSDSERTETARTAHTQEWKEVQNRIHNQRKARDECGLDCRLF
jgi:hypothetical protein